MRRSLHSQQRWGAKGPAKPLLASSHLQPHSCQEGPRLLLGHLKPGESSPDVLPLGLVVISHCKHMLLQHSQFWGMRADSCCRLTLHHSKLLPYNHLKTRGFPLLRLQSLWKTVMKGLGKECGIALPSILFPLLRLL